MKDIFLVFVAASFLSSCTTSKIVINVQRPADISLSQDIKNVVIVNRSLPSKENLAGNILEGLISGEGVGADRKGSEYCIEGLSNMMQESERYILKNAGGMQLKGTGTSSFPIPLHWNEVMSICGSYGGDAILSLETFDSDSRIIIGNPVTKIKKIKGVRVKEIRYLATLIMEIQSGWRIYDVENKKIVDENIFTEVKEFNSWGNTPEEARINLPSKRNAIKRSGVLAGEQYGYRISPMWVKVNRTYYTGKSDDLKEAKKYVSRRDWDTAISIWKGLVDSSDDKIARRSAYNMAIFSEIKGGLDTAIEWAKKAQDLGEKKAYNYIQILNKRKRDEEKLKQQLIN